jgi:hypothetical protein
MAPAPAPAARSHPRTSGHPVHVRSRVPVRPARQRGGGAAGAGDARAASSSSWGRLVTPVTSNRLVSAVPAPSKCTRNSALMRRVASNSSPVRRARNEPISPTKITAGWWHRPQQTARAPSSRRPHPLGRQRGRQRGRADADGGGLCCAGNALADHRLAGPQRAQQQQALVWLAKAVEQLSVQRPHIHGRPARALGAAGTSASDSSSAVYCRRKHRLLQQPRLCVVAHVPRAFLSPGRRRVGRPSAPPRP